MEEKEKGGQSGLTGQQKSIKKQVTTAYLQF